MENSIAVVAYAAPDVSKSRLADLLRFLRERGCIAYAPGDGRTNRKVIRAHLFGKQESDEIRQLAFTD